MYSRVSIRKAMLKYADHVENTAWTIRFIMFTHSQCTMYFSIIEIVKNTLFRR